MEKAMNIMVFDVPAESGGALSILNEFYNEYDIDKKNNYVFVISKPKLENTSNIRVIRYPWVKKSWLHRLYFDNFVAPRIIRRYEIENVISLQNVIIPHTKVHQTVYVHNALPFVEYKYSITENGLLWVYQNIIGKSIYKSIKKASKVVVQSEWMKKACVRRLGVNEAKIYVIPPKINIEVKKQFRPTKESLSTFFYPASGVDFKNHKTIINACIELNNAGINNYKVVLTLNGDENRNISSLYEKVKKDGLPVEFIGSISREKVFDYYSNSILVFPSFIETVGLPLLEAKMHGTPILASDCAFSHEILDGYENVQFFNAFNSSELAKKFSEAIKG